MTKTLIVDFSETHDSDRDMKAVDYVNTLASASVTQHDWGSQTSADRPKSSRLLFLPVCQWQYKIGSDRRASVVVAREVST